MATGTPKVIGFAMAAQRPVDEWYLNEAAPWATTAAALAGIPIGSRSPGQQVNIAGVLYWFDVGLTTLSTVLSGALPTAAQVTIADTGTLYDAVNVEEALAEVKTQADATDAAVAALGGTDQTTFRIDFTAANKVVATRVAAAVETTDYPTGWTLAANASVNLLITHTLTGRKLSEVNVYEIDGANERLLPKFSAAFSGVLCNGLTILIEGLAPVDLALRIELIIH